MKMKFLFFMLLFAQIGCKNITGIFDNSKEPAKQQETLENITLNVDKEVYSADDTIHVRLLNASSAPLFLEGCNQLFIETKVDTGWSTSTLWECVWEGYAVKILSDSSYVLDSPAEHLRGTHRFVAPLYFGCKDGEPISSGQCNRRETVYSMEFTVQ